MGSALGLASWTLRQRPFQRAPCSTFMARSLSSSLLKVTKAKVCLRNSLVLCGLRPCLARNLFMSLKPTYWGSKCLTNTNIIIIIIMKRPSQPVPHPVHPPPRLP
uniref:Uncharacterized protein n=1 Tax=Ornithorhynchus anatinus TaxID=9258 RepID=A0A6I8NRL7_ORNAN